MKKALFASTALAAMAIGGVASAEVALFGDARLGFGYKVDNDGDFHDTEDDLRAISRVRFGVNMTGETDTGITFGATVRADNSIGGEGAPVDVDTVGNPLGNDFFERTVTNQTAGNVFVSGDFGTLTYGDTDEAHQAHVGDLPELGLTGLTFANELPYLGNRQFGNSYRPTVRYDFDIAGFGASLSTGNELDSIAVGASYTFEFGGRSITAGAGYFDGSANDVIDELTGDDVEQDATQIAAGLSAEFGIVSASAKYTLADLGDDDFETLGFGFGTTIGNFGVNGLYNMILDDGAGGDDDAYGVDVTYDLGGGASIKGGVVQTFGLLSGDGDDDNELIADLGISMSF